ncbi:hypothetical protein PO909_000326 [Leuciscus waleckii]
MTKTDVRKQTRWLATFEEVVGEVTYAVKQSNFVVLFERWLLPAPRSYIVPVKAIQTPSGSGRRLIQPIAIPGAAAVKGVSESAAEKAAPESAPEASAVISACESADVRAAVDLAAEAVLQSVSARQEMPVVIAAKTLSNYLSSLVKLLEVPVKPVVPSSPVPIASESAVPESTAGRVVPESAAESSVPESTAESAVPVSAAENAGSKSASDNAVPESVAGYAVSESEMGSVDSDVKSAGTGSAVEFADPVPAPQPAEASSLPVPQSPATPPVMRPVPLPAVPLVRFPISPPSVPLCVSPDAPVTTSPWTVSPKNVPRVSPSKSRQIPRPQPSSRRPKTPSPPIHHGLPPMDFSVMSRV